MEFTPAHEPATVQHAMESAVSILKSQGKPKHLAAAKKLQPGLTVVRADNRAASRRKITQVTLAQAMGPDARVEAARRATIQDEFYMPRNREAALVQSAMARRMRLAQTAAPGTAAALPLGEPFSDTDPGWIEVVKDMAVRILRDDAKFISHTKLTDFVFNIGDNDGVCLFADWGTGTAEAALVARQIEARNPAHWIHLGDVYYAGEEDDEIAPRFLDVLPKPAALQSRWGLNGNHEMYGGGYGYFGKALAQLGPIGGTGQPASYFALENANWRIIGLDSAYADFSGKHGNLDVDKKLGKASQLAWLEAQLAKADGKKCILLTHHQPFSAFEDDNDKIRKQIKKHLDAGRIHAWFFGHEHRHVVFQRFAGTLGRCIGHGAIPYEPPSGTLIDGHPPVQFVNRRTQDGVHCVHGFAHLQFNGAKLRVDYGDEDGTVPFAEDLESL